MNKEKEVTRTIKFFITVTASLFLIGWLPENIAGKKEMVRKGDCFLIEREDLTMTGIVISARIVEKKEYFLLSGLRMRESGQLFSRECLSPEKVAFKVPFPGARKVSCLAAKKAIEILLETFGLCGEVKI